MGAQPVHEWDIAASNPCPFCPKLRDCPHDLKPTTACLELWPLGRPESRSWHILEERDPDLKIALANAIVSDIAERWLAGERLTDDDYLSLRGLINEASTDEAASAYLIVTAEFLWARTYQQYCDAVDSYPLDCNRSDEYYVLSGIGVFGGIVCANDYMVRNDSCVQVPSHFERIVLEVHRVFLWAAAGKPSIRLPRNNSDFKLAVERHWLEVLTYGNGYYGFTVLPLIHIDDLVRYQQLGGGDDLVSWSISNWVIWSMTAFPSIVQTLIPDFGERAFGSRLRKMYEPLVQSYATKFVKRAELIDGKADAPKRSDVAGELRALLWHAIKEYDFNYGKPDAMLSSVGAVGPESSPRWREDLDRRFREFDLPFSARDVAHVGFPRYVVGKFDEHLRESYRWHDPEFGEADKQSGAIVEGSGEAAEVFEEETNRTRRKSNAGTGVRVAHEKGGVKYLYIKQMAYVCGPEITEDQLRNWDQRGHLETLRMRDVDPGAPSTIADRRIYPYTNEMIQRIHELAERKEMLQADPTEGVLSRKEAAARLGITTRTLDNWRRDGKVEEYEMEHRVFIAEDEVERLLAQQEQT